MAAIRREVHLPDPEATDALGTRLAALVRSGDTLLLTGGIGAGKSHLCRALIHAAQRAAGQPLEDVPSPTYTLIQSYDVGETTILHADLYRLTGAGEAEELGLLDAFGTDLCLVEWPDRLGEEAPNYALSIQLNQLPDTEGRLATLEASAPRWSDPVAQLAEEFAP